MTGAASLSKTGGAPGLLRTLRLRDVIIYGVILVSPISPAPIFGSLSHKAQGHAAIAIRFAMFAMLPTAISYGRMARAYPSAGSAFTFVGNEIGATLGYLTGWGMMMDYILNAMISMIWVSQQATVFVPAVPYSMWVVFFAIASTVVTAQGVHMTARANTVMGAVLGVIVAVYLAAACHYIAVQPHTTPGYFVRPFYESSTWDWHAILASTSLAMLIFIGFDGISTLSEEVHNPERNIMRATIATCLIVAALSVAEAYTAELVWPVSGAYPNIDTAFTFAAGRAWAPLFVLVGFAIMLSLLAVAVAAQLAVARLLFGMGRSGSLPRSFFGAIHPTAHVPRNNVYLVGLVAMLGAIALPLVSGNATGYELGANLVNFGALVSFMGVNASVVFRYYLRADERRLREIILPIVGFAICLLLLVNLGQRALVFGLVWMVIGVAFGAWRTGGFRTRIAIFDDAAQLLAETD